MKQYILTAVIAAAVAGGVAAGVSYLTHPLPHVSPVTKISRVARVAWLLFGDAGEANAQGFGSEAPSAGGWNMASTLLALLGLSLALWALFGPQIKAASASLVQRAKTLKLPAFSWTFRLNGDLRVVIAIALIVYALGTHGCDAKWPAISVPWISVKATAVVYTYEKDQGVVPSAVAVALDKLNRQGIRATEDEVDNVDGTNEVPDQYKASRPAAKQAGLPALVVLGGDKVLRVVKAPTTQAAVLEAAK